MVKTYNIIHFFPATTLNVIPSGSFSFCKGFKYLTIMLSDTSGAITNMPLLLRLWKL